MTTPSGQKDDPLAFLAQQILELNNSLKALPELQQDSKEIKRDIRMIRGWMEGQEEITAAHARSLFRVNDTLDHIERRMGEHSEKLDKVAGYGAEVGQNVGGVIELAQSTFDIVAKLKEDLNIMKAPGETSGSERTEATQ